MPSSVHLRHEDKGIEHSRKGVYVAMPRALTEYANPQALGGIDEHERKAGKGSCRPGGFNSGSPDPFRPVTVPLFGESRQDQSERALRTAKAKSTRPETARLGENWTPAGIPARIASNALESALKRSQREELARFETFLFENYIGRIPYKDSRLNERTASKLIESRLSSGHWLKVKEPCNYWENKGKRVMASCSPVLRNLPPVYMLSPDYLEEIAREDMERARLSRLTASKPPKHRKPKPPAGIDRETALWLSEGGIIWKPLRLLSMLADPFTFSEALRGWKKLSPFTASRPLRPTWAVRGRGWLYATKPALQMLPAIVRSNALTVRGSLLAEVDYKACQCNILNYLNGMETMEDPLTYHRQRLELEHGLTISRQELKTALYPVFHGRTRLTVIKKAKWNLGLTEEQAVTLWQAIEPFRNGAERGLMEIQGQMIIASLELLTGADPVIPLFDAIATIEPDRVKEIMEAVSAETLGDETARITAEIKRAGQRQLFTG